MYIYIYMYIYVYICIYIYSNTGHHRAHCFHEIYSYIHIFILLINIVPERNEKNF